MRESAKRELMKKATQLRHIAANPNISLEIRTKATQDAWRIEERLYHADPRPIPKVPKFEEVGHETLPEARPDPCVSNDEKSRQKPKLRGENYDRRTKNC